MPGVQILALPSPLAPRTVPEVRQLAHDYAEQIAAMLTSGEPPDEMPVVTQPATTKKNPYPLCLCGCGQPNKQGRRFNQGHDMKVDSCLKQVNAGTMGAESLPAVLLEAARNTPTLEVHGFVISELIRRSGNAVSPAG